METQQANTIIADTKKLNNDVQFKKKPIKAAQKESIIGFIMALPPVLGFVLFGLIPIAVSIIFSFTKLHRWDLAGIEFIKFNNYKWLLNDANFYKSIINTIYYTSNVFIGLVISILIAVVLSKTIKFNKFFAVIFFIPYICSIVAVSNMWKWMFEANYGIINSFLKSLSISPVEWLQNSKTFMLSIIIMTVWSSIGFNVILLQSAIANVDKSYYEAADIDGANSMVKFFKVTFPGVTPTLFYIIVMGVIASLQAFTPMQIMTDGQSFGPDNSGMTVVYYLYRMSFDFRPSMGIGLASALACLLAVFIGGVTLLNFKFSKWVKYDE